MTPTPEVRWAAAKTALFPEAGAFAVFMEWQPDPGERALIADGALIRLGIYGMEPIPPVSLGVSTEPVVTADEPPKGDLRGVLDRVEVRPPGPPRPPAPPRDREMG